MIDNALKDLRDSTEKRLTTIVEIYEDVKGLNTGKPPAGYPAADLSRCGYRSRNHRVLQAANAYKPGVRFRSVDHLPD